MTIKHLGGIFGRNPEFNDVVIDNNLAVGTDNPQSKLHVSSPDETIVIIQGDNDNDAGEEGAFLEFQTDGTAVKHKMGIKQGTNNDLFVMAGEGASSSVATGINLQTKGTGTTTTDLKVRIDSSGHLQLGGSTTITGEGSFVIYNGTAPTGGATNGCILFAQDVSSSSELKVMDEAGNVTTLSPHNFQLIPEGQSEDMAWSYYSEKGGKRINVDMLKAIRVLEKMSGEQLVYED